MINRVTSCLPSLIVGSTGCFALSAAATGGARLASTVAPVVIAAVCFRNCLRLLEPLVREDMRPTYRRGARTQAPPILDWRGCLFKCRLVSCYRLGTARRLDGAVTTGEEVPPRRQH